MAVSCMRHATGHNYRNSSFIVDVAMGQIPRSTERISSNFMCLTAHYKIISYLPVPQNNLANRQTSGCSMYISTLGYHLR